MIDLTNVNWEHFYDEAVEMATLYTSPKPYTSEARMSSLLNLMNISDDALRLDPQVDTMRELRKLYHSLMHQYTEQSGEEESTVLANLRAVFVSKNHDYGSSFCDLGLISILVRLYDKLKRLSNLTKKRAKVSTETVRDTLLDAINYSLMALAFVFAKDSQE